MKESDHHVHDHHEESVVGGGPDYGYGYGERRRGLDCPGSFQSVHSHGHSHDGPGLCVGGCDCHAGGSPCAVKLRTKKYEI